MTETIITLIIILIFTTILLAGKAPVPVVIFFALFILLLSSPLLYEELYVIPKEKREEEMRLETERRQHEGATREWIRIVNEDRKKCDAHFKKLGKSQEERDEICRFHQ